jgi:hypothetical protein
VEVERVGDLFGLLESPNRGRAPRNADAVVLQHAADGDRGLRRIAAVAVDQQVGAIAERLADQGHDRLGAAGPLVLVMAAFAADPELEGARSRSGRAGASSRSASASGVMSRLHAGGVGAHATGRAAQQLAHALAGPLALQVPQRRVEPGQGAVEVGAGEFVLALRDQRHQRRDIGRIPAERMGRDLAVEHGGGDVGVVVRKLAPALGAVIRDDTDEADERVRIGFEALDLHRGVLGLAAITPSSQSVFICGTAASSRFV